MKLAYVPGMRYSFMTMIVVDEELRVIASRQITSVPFIPLITGLITSLVTSGKAFAVNSLKLNRTDFTVRCSGAWLGPLFRNSLPYHTGVIPPSGIPKVLHSTVLPSVMLQVNSS